MVLSTVLVILISAHFLYPILGKCPDECHCYPFKWGDASVGVDCKSSNLQTIPTNLPWRISKADFSMNKLGTTQDFKIDLPFSPSVKQLDFSANFLESKHIKDIPDSVEILDLSANSITDFSLDDLPRHIRGLNLAKNGANILNGCGRGKKLASKEQIWMRFDYNYIPIIIADTFANCGASFGYLDFSSNNLHTIEPHAFRGVAPRENESLAIDLSYNQLETIPFEALQDSIFENLGFNHFSLDLRKNPIVCSCNMSWVPMAAEYYRKIGLRVTILGNCFSPLEKSGILLEDLNKLDFKSCSQYNWLKAEMKERTDQRVMPFWQVCIVVLALPALVAAVVLAVGIRMHMKDYRRYKDYITIKKQRMMAQKRRRHFRASGAMGDVLLNSSNKHF
ncbi:reticulon-4 receptor-like 1 [Symsagittifera roscoffensis]|uniref:reticulon-4 receptor-like 1 n=1 Tax=Symsagittifera roscoffensis TaxID=84072 RepID=UPI00307BB553